jgi:hypothetical protein
MKKVLTLFAAFLAVLLLFSLTGCMEITSVTGSKNLALKQYNLHGFKKIEISNLFTVDVTQSDTYNVSVTLNDNLFDYLDISVSGDTLNIHMNPNSHIINSTQRVAISLPQLDSLKISGACTAAVTGFQLDGALNLDTESASGITITDVKAANTNITVLSASYVSGNLNTDTCNFQVTGASNINLLGAASRMTLSVIGASHAGLKNFIVQDASVTAEGVSTAEVQAHGTLDLEVSGVSTVTYYDDPKLGKVEVSGVSTLTRR